MSGAKPLHPGLFTWPDQNPSLLGSLCLDCGEHAFPSQRSCRACSGQNTRDAELGNAGTLWTWTIQSFMPKTPYIGTENPEDFEPYPVGYIELPGQIMVCLLYTSPSPRDQRGSRMPCSG